MWRWGEPGFAQCYPWRCLSVGLGRAPPWRQVRGRAGRYCPARAPLASADEGGAAGVSPSRGSCSPPAAVLTAEDRGGSRRVRNAIARAMSERGR